MKKLVPVRLLKNEFADAIAQAEAEGANTAHLLNLLGRARAKLGMFDGDMEQGELEIGQVSAMLNEIKPAATILKEIWDEFLTEKQNLEALNFNTE
jgi:enoyl-[acyl-carrier protein] reductase II